MKRRNNTIGKKNCLVHIKRTALNKVIIKSASDIFNEKFDLYNFSKRSRFAFNWFAFQSRKGDRNAFNKKLHDIQ